MEVVRYKYVFVVMIFLSSHINTEKVTKTKTTPSCPYTKILEDIFKVNNKTAEHTPMSNSERAKLFLHSIAKVTESNEVSQEELVNDIIAAINRIKNNITKEDNENRLNEAIILPPKPNVTEKHKVPVQIKSGVEDKIDALNHSTVKKQATQSQQEHSNKTVTQINTTEKTNYVEVLTIEPNNTQKSNVSSHNIIEVLKHLMPMFNSTLTKELHNITIIERNFNKNHSFSATKNVSTIVVTYCDKGNSTQRNVTFESGKETSSKEPIDKNDDYDYYTEVDSEDDDEGDMTTGEKRDILEAAEYGMQKMHELYSVLEPKLYSMGLWLDDTNPARYVAAFNAPSEDSARYTRYGYASLQAATKLKELASGGNSDGLEGRTEEAQFPKASALRQSSLMQHCPSKGLPKCPPASKRYRTHDGTCNNLNRPRWGSTMTPVQRFLPPSYSDGLQAPRRSVTGATLPSAREISALIHESKNVESPGITHLLMQWGQFVDHDVTSSSQSRGFNGSVPRCCKNGGRDFVPKDLMHPECFPIPVPSSDPFYGPRGVRCLDFVRSSPAPRDDCALGWREQLNQVSAYIDGSPLYATSARQSDKLRLFRNGMLQYGRVPQRRPEVAGQRGELCRGGALSADCFMSGDARVNEHPGLVAAHIVWLRLHNRMAQELAHLNPHWSDEKIYQETRKIVGAMIQHITYREFLPIVLGPEVTRTFELDLQKKGYYKHYSPKINPSPASSFGSAAFRFGHSLVQSSMVRFDKFHRPMDNNVSLHEELTNPTNIWSMGAVDRLLLGMLNQPIQKRDEFITDELTNHLFQTPQFNFGMDLAAINIQRGRDHGVPPYTSWREPCGLSATTEFEDLFKVMPARVVWKLKVLYRHVDDIDLFTGGMAERPVVGGLVGPTFACIIAQQFLNLRKGDRFWYENGGFESSFTPAQLQQLRRISLAQVLCRTLDSITNIQPFAFLSPDHQDNERISCQNGLLNNFDLSPWIEIDSENDIRKSDYEDHTTQKPKRPKPTTSKPVTTRKTVSHNKVLSKKPLSNSTKTTNVTEHEVDLNETDSAAKDSFDLTIDALTKDDAKIQIDDKLDFKNKTKHFDDYNTDSRNNRPKKKYDDYDYDDEDTQSVQSVVINNSPKRPYNNNYNRPVLTVTENTNKYTYLINYVPRPTESYRQTTRRPDRDVVKVTYQTYDDTYRRQKPYYYNRHEVNDNYRNNRPNTRTTIKDVQSSARSNDHIETTTTKPTIKPKLDHKTDGPTTENMYKLVTFGYVGTYKGDMTDDKLLSENIDADKQTEDKKRDTISKDFLTDHAKSDTEDTTERVKLSTFYLYDTATKSNNLQRSTRRNDDTVDMIRHKYYYVNNVLHRYPIDATKNNNDIPDINPNKESPVPIVNVEERSSIDGMSIMEKSAADKSKIKLKSPANSPKTPSVAFQVIPSEISPSQWAVYEEDSSLPEGTHSMPPLKTDPHALREIPRPMTLSGLRRRRPGLF